MKKKIIVPIIMMIACICLTVLCYIILPENVIIQLSLTTSQNPTLPKLTAILIPLAFCVGGSIGSFFTDDENIFKNKGIIISVIGIVIYIIMLMVNLLMN